MAWERYVVSVEGAAPLLMHNPRGADKLDPLAQELALITSKPAKKRTEEDERLISDLEWRIGIYADEKGRPLIPGNCLRGLIIGGAQKSRRGTQAKAGVACDNALLLGVGKRTVADLFADPNFRDRRSVKIGQARIMRTRPIFRTWTIDFHVDLDTDLFGKKELIDALQQGQKIGLLDGRPQFGRFLVKSVEKE